MYSTAQAKRRLIARVIITRTASNSPSADHICRGWPCGSSEAPCCVVFSLQRRAQRVRPGVGPPVGRRRARFEAADHPHRRDRWARTCVRRLVQVTLAHVVCSRLHVVCCATGLRRQSAGKHAVGPTCALPAAVHSTRFRLAGRIEPSVPASEPVCEGERVRCIRENGPGTEHFSSVFER